MAQKLFGPNGFINFIEDQQRNVTIYWAGMEYYSFNRDDRTAKSIGIAIMSSIGVSQKDICLIFQVSRNTITNISSRVDTFGFDGLVGYRPGPKIIDEEMRKFVIGKYLELDGRWGYQRAILEEMRQKYEKGEFPQVLSRQSLWVIIKEYREQKERERQQRVEEKLHQDQHQKEKQEEAQEEKKAEQQQPELKPPQAEGEERCVEAGGATVAAVYLNSFGMMGRVPEGFESQGEEKFSNRELALSYAALNAAKLVRVEQHFKTLPSWEMGGIIGRWKLPSLSLYRSRIPKVVEAMDMREVIRETAKQMREQMDFSQVLYVDGHFLPYYGSSEVLSGYNSQRRLAMEGREYFFVHDEQGLPVYAILSDGYRKMRHYLEVIDTDLRYIYGVKERQLLEIFDRGGYSKGFCVGVTDRIRFICWRSDAREEMPKIRGWERIDVQREGNEWGEWNKVPFYGWEREAVYEADGKRARFREVWIRRGQKVSAALTNDEQLPLGEVVRKLVRRWGAQENGFKKLKEHGIDRIHSRLKEEYTKEFLYEQGLEERERGIEHVVENPVVRGLKKQIAEVKRDLAKVEKAQGTALKKGKKEEARRLRKKCVQLQRKLKKLDERKSGEPAKVLLWDRIQGEGIERICDEKKLFYDWLKMGAIWARKKIVDAVKPFYRDLRDVEKFVDSILQSRTYVKEEGTTMHVDFPQQHSKIRQEALEQMCAELNGCRELDVGPKAKKVIFRVR